MITNKPVITTGQLFGMLFISRMIVNMTYNPSTTGGESMWDHVLSCAISFVLTFLMVIPVYILCNLRGGIDIANISYLLLGKIGGIICFIYTLYFIFVAIYTLSMFNSFVSNVMSPKTPLLTLSFAVVIVASYAACKGIEGIARASFFILVLVVIAIIFIILALIPQVDVRNYPAFMYDGSSQTINGVILMFSRTSCIPAMAMLLPLSKGNKKTGIIIWNISVYLTIAILITVIVGSLGDYLKTQSFPIYTATCIAEMGILRKLDALYLGIWMTGLFVKISLFIYLASSCVKKVYRKRSFKMSASIIGLLIAILSFYASNSSKIISYFYNINIIAIFTLITAVIIPLFLIIVNLLKSRRSCK